MQTVAADVFGPQAFDPDRVTIDWWQAGVQWQEDDGGRIVWATVWDAERFAEVFPGVSHTDAVAVARAVEAHDVPTLVYDQSMAAWEEDQSDRQAEWHAEQAFDGGALLMAPSIREALRRAGFVLACLGVFVAICAFCMCEQAFAPEVAR